MRGWRFINVRHPFWRISGLALILAATAATALMVGRGPRPLKPRTGISGPEDEGQRGRVGTFTESLGKSLFRLTYDSVEGRERDLLLQGVTGRLEESPALWRMKAPTARKQGDAWILMGPMNMESLGSDGQELQGRGTITAPGPALGWEKGVWKGLSPLLWEDLQGGGRGRWHLPAGWERGLDGRFKVEKGPVRWEATDEGTIHAMEAQRMWAALGLQEGWLEGVEARLDGGRVQARTVEVKPDWLRWPQPITFQRDDGWAGSASQGQAPRPPQGQPLDRVELHDFQARRPLDKGLEQLQARGARWTAAGLRLEGDVRWEQPVDGDRLTLRAPRVLQRSGPGTDLPRELPPGEAWAEGTPVLSWGRRTLSSPRMEGRQGTHQWRLRAPVLGRGELGSFRGGEAEGDPRRWNVAGPILAQLSDGSSIRADHLVWENAQWILAGRPATWTRPRQRLSGPRVVRREEGVHFTAGVAGALAAPEGDLTLRADQGRALKTQVLLEGRVECAGQGWRLQADRISVTLGPGNMVRKVFADGSVVLHGRMGEGRGDSLEMDPSRNSAAWKGRVKALTEVQP